MIKVAEPSLTVGLLPRFASSDVRELSLMLTQRLQAITLLESPLSRAVRVDLLRARAVARPSGSARYE